MSLETVSWPATSHCQEWQGRPVSRQPDEIYRAHSLVTGELHRQQEQQSYVTLCLHVDNLLKRCQLLFLLKEIV